MNEQVVWFYGTNSKEMVSEIEREGFQEGTYFAQHMEDAVVFGIPSLILTILSKNEFISNPVSRK